MDIDKRTAVTRWMNDQGLRDPSQLSSADHAELLRLLSSERKGFGIFLSLMQFQRAQWAIQLTNADLSNSAGAVAAAKLQGSIQMVDTMRELVLAIADPMPVEQPAAREIAGVRFSHDDHRE